MSDNLTMEKIKETAMVDLAYNCLKEHGEPMLYSNIMKEVASLKGFTEQDVERYIAQLYTEINIDGRFVCVGRSLWGLKEWYPIEQSTDSAVAAHLKDDFVDEEEDDHLFEHDDDFESDEVIDLDDEDLDLAYDEEEDDAFGGRSSDGDDHLDDDEDDL